MTNIAIFASGNGTDMQAIVNGCKNKKINANVNLVISNNPDAYVLKRAKNENIDAYCLNSNQFNDLKAFEKEMLYMLEKHQIDIIFLAGYLKMLPISIIEKYDNKIFNIHPSLLPKYGGKGMYGIHVHEAVIQNREKETGITIHKVNSEYDKGEIIAQTKMKVNENDTPQTLAKRVLEKEHEFLVETLNKIVINLNNEKSR